MRFSASISAFFLVILLLTPSGSGADNPVAERYFKGMDYASEGRFAEARAEFEGALDITASFTPAREGIRVVDEVLGGKVETAAAVSFFRGAAKINDGNLEEAFTDLTRAIELYPEFVAAYNARGLAYEGLNMHERAVEDFTRAIEIDPVYPAAYNNRGISERRRRLFDKAVEDFSRAIELDPASAETYNNRGYVYFVHLMDRIRGCQDFKQACSLGRCTNFHVTLKKGQCR
ncbi:MAG TPA: tetratricopeptide repeat protein [Thermodesulfobacteriota bacterium]|nr:tetratricopeptide repeat protein [Thermodesulfobacteriota bacterium]